MKGHIRERSPGHWAIVIDVRDPETNKRKRRWHSFAGTQRQAQIERARLITKLQDGTAIEPSRMTVAAFLERWIEHMQGQVSPRSHERYAELCRKNIAPLLGGLTLAKLQPAHISTAYAKALTSGRRDGQGGLSPRTVTHMHRVLREALQQAVRWQMLARNPADAVKPPRVERKQMSVLDTDATAELITAARGSSLAVPILFGVLCGLRRGEIVALRWRNVDLERGQLSVVASTEQTDAGCREKEPKSGRGRTVALAPLMVEELRGHRLRQAEGLLACAAYRRPPRRRPRGWSGIAAALAYPCLREIRSPARPTNSAARLAPYPCHTHVGIGSPSEDRAGTAWPFERWDHPRSLLACAAGNAGRGGGSG
jgi:integrase